MCMAMIATGSTGSLQISDSPASHEKGHAGNPPVMRFFIAWEPPMNTIVIPFLYPT